MEVQRVLGLVEGRRPPPCEAQGVARGSYGVPQQRRCRSCRRRRDRPPQRSCPSRGSGMIGPTRRDWQRRCDESVDVRHRPRVAKYPTRELMPLLGEGEVGHPLLARLEEDGGRRVLRRSRGCGRQGLGGWVVGGGRVDDPKGRGHELPLDRHRRLGGGQGVALVLLRPPRRCAASSAARLGRGRG